MKLYVDVFDTQKSKMFIFELFVNKNILIKDFLFEVNRLLKYDDIEYDDDYIGFFDFVDTKFRKGRLDYPLLKFVRNFGNNSNVIRLNYYPAYGIGGDFFLKDIACIRLNNNEPIYECPHVHVENPNIHEEYVRISLLNFLPMNDEKWPKYFNKKRRKLVVKILKENKDMLLSLYHDLTNGQYIENDYYIEHGLIKYYFSARRNF